MAEYLAPGVYMEEFSSGLTPMEGVSTSTAGFVGLTRRGPVCCPPVFVSSFSDFTRKFGGYLSKEKYGPNRFLPYAVEQFFNNGGARCYISRVLPDLKTAVSATASGGSITLTAKNPGEWGNALKVAVKQDAVKETQYQLLVTCDDGEELYGAVTLDASDDNYLPRVLEKNSVLLRAEVGEGADMTIFAAEEAAGWKSVTLAGGTDGTADFKAMLSADTFIGEDGGAGKRTGLKALAEIPEISIIAVPGVTDNNVEVAVKDQCENLLSRVGILDMPEDLNDVGKIKDFRTGTGIDSSYVAMYHPWIESFDPLRKLPGYFPPSGAIAGIYARSDTTRGVYKAPANETLRGCTGLESLFGKAEQDMLNPIGVNLIRSFPGQGIRVWGARTCSSNGQWKYINVRRLFIFIEETIRRNTGWAVFEPNDQMLWTKVRASITSFLGTLWRDGALAGTTEDEAFFVHVGHDTMTQDDILNGRMICVIGVAPVRPAEFVIFRITQIMESSNG